MTETGTRTPLIKERYELLETLGAGGEGRVVKALDHQHDRVVALKIRPARSAHAREELLGEARILLALSPHPALPLVREDFFDGEDYIVAMDWVDGTDLAQLLRDRGRPGLAPSSVLAYLSEVAEALTHLHVQEPPVIHGDVKPSNLILTRGGRIKLVDFGLSSAPNAMRRRTGTPGFRAPELASEGRPSRASDIYALAATAFALLSGAPPMGVLPKWEGIDPVQAAQIEGAIRLGMATDPARRPATPGELVERMRAGWAQTLPTGVATFCLSDIESSTALWDSQPVAMAQALVRHDELIADCMEARGGRLIKSMGEGDSTVSVFTSAPDALHAAVDAARALSAEPWPGGIRIAARFGLHTGEADRRGTDYFGPVISLAARLRSQADGGQIFLSSVTSDLVAGHLPDGCELVGLGPHRLRGFRAPEYLHALKGPGVLAPSPVTDCPYRGLLAFEPKDRAFFFGREAVVAELLGRLSPARLAAVVGPSGSGKSSVLRAGVVAAVSAGEVPAMARARLLTPGAAPELPEDIELGELVVVDQFEELFTLCDDPERRRRFIDAVLRVPGPVVIGVRADIYGRLTEHAELARAAADNQVLLGAMTSTELERAVREPARLAGLRLEPGLVELALRDVADEPGALPLLSHALRATWERRDGRTLTVEGYRDSGGVASALAQTADAVLDSLPPERRQLSRAMFLRLVELGDGGNGARRRVAVDELMVGDAPGADISALIARLADARLLTLGDGTVEVAHEVLIRAWPTLRTWLDEDRAGIRLHQQLSHAARLWEAGGRETADLYRGARLAATTEWAEQHRDELNAIERNFLSAGIAHQDRERRAQLRANRRLRGLLAGAVALLVLALVAGTVALIQRSHAQAQALTSDAERLGALAQTEPALDRALLYAVAGVTLENRVQTRSDLLAALQRSPGLVRLLRPGTSQIVAMQVSPDGRRLAIADSSGAVRFLAAPAWRSQGVVVHLPDPVARQAMSFSADGRRLAVVTTGPARADLDLIDVVSGASRRLASWAGLIPAFPNLSVAVVYAPDDRSIAVSTITQSPADPAPTAERLAMVDTASRVRWQRRYSMRPNQGLPNLAFTRSGELVSSAPQGDTLVWDARSGRVARRFGLGGMLAVAGERAAIAVNSPSLAYPSSSMWILDLRTGARRRLAADLPSSWVESLAFTPGSAHVVADTLEDVKVWDVSTGLIGDTFAGQPGRRSTLALAPGGRLAFDGGQDGSVAVFDLAGTQRLGRFFSWGTPALACLNSPCAVVNPQGIMATDQSDGTVALVDLRTLRRLRTLTALDSSSASAIAFSPDGRTLITGGSNGHVTLRDVRTGAVSRTLRFSEPVWLVAVSPDARELAVQTQASDSNDTHVQVVDLTHDRLVQSHLVPGGAAGLVFSSDGRELAALGCCAGGSTLAAWATQTGVQLYRRSGGPQLTAIGLSAHAPLLGAGTASGAVLLFDPRTGRERSAPLPVAAGRIIDIAFSPDGHEFAVSSNDGTESLWDVASGTRLGNPFPPYPGAIADVTFEPNGRLLMPLVSNAFEWPSDADSWKRYACQVAGRELTPSEWHAVLPGRAYRQVCAL